MFRDVDLRLLLAASAAGALAAVAVTELRRALSGGEELSPGALEQLANRVKQELERRRLQRNPSGRALRSSSTEFLREEEGGRMDRLASERGEGDAMMMLAKHTDDAALRALNVNLMERGRAANSRPVGARYGPKKTKVVRIALTGGPCAGKSSALAHLIAQATAEGFDVLTAPEVATLYFNSSYQFPSTYSPDFAEQKYQFQANIMKLQLQMERCYSTLGGSTGRPTIVVFDRGLRDASAFMTPEEWARGLAELDKELPGGPSGRITEDYVLQRYDGIIHLVTAADGAEEHYKFGIVEDDTGNQVYRRETPAEAVEQDRKLQEAWQGHPHHVVVDNTDARGFQGKLEEATDAILAIARVVHPKEAKRAKQIREERARLKCGD